MPSYSVKCHFEWSAAKSKTHAHLYEERITLWRANSIDEAIEAAEREALVYAEQNGFTFIELSQAFWMFSDLEGDGLELFSLLRESDLESAAYLDFFHDTGFERESKQAEVVARQPLNSFAVGFHSPSSSAVGAHLTLCQEAESSHVRISP